jgi:hypothetical protein
MGPCQLICFFDGSDDAFAAAIYVRWKLNDDSFDVSLLCAKPRVTPSKRISTPRSELNGAVLASRIALSEVGSLTNAGISIERLWFIGDSECILACLEKTNCAFGEYFGNRVGEILDTQAKLKDYVESERTVNGGIQPRVTMQQIKQHAVTHLLSIYCRSQDGSKGLNISGVQFQNGPSVGNFQLVRMIVFPLTNC